MDTLRNERYMYHIRIAVQDYVIQSRQFDYEQAIELPYPTYTEHFMQQALDDINHFTYYLQNPGFKA